MGHGNELLTANELLPAEDALSGLSIYCENEVTAFDVVLSNTYGKVTIVTILKGITIHLSIAINLFHSMVVLVLTLHMTSFHITFHVSQSLFLDMQ